MEFSVEAQLKIIWEASYSCVQGYMCKTFAEKVREPRQESIYSFFQGMFIE